MVCIWTAFECFASDLWVTALNENPYPLAQRVLKSLDEPSGGLSSKHIELGLAARHDFDLRRCLGTLLKQRFDFTGVKGITTAYERAFGICKLSEEPRARNLKTLEQLRHLIVHRGGFADDDFIRVTRLRVRRGAAVRIKPVDIENYVLAASIGSARLLETVEEWAKGSS